MDKKFYFLSDGGAPVDARMMTEAEAFKAQEGADAATDGNFTWWGPFDVSGPFASERWKITTAQ